MAAVSSIGVITISAQIVLLLSLIGCGSAAKLPAEQQKQLAQADSKANEVISEGHIFSAGTGPAVRNSVPIVANDFEVVSHTGTDALGRQKRYIGWGRSPRLRYSKATSAFDADSLFNKMHNTFDKRLGPEAPISSFRELRMKQKVPNVQLLLPHLQMRNVRVPSPGTDADGADGMLNDLDRPTAGKLTQEDLEALAYLLEGDVQ